MRSPNKPLTHFGKMVAKALVDKGMTKAELAETIGIAPQYLSHILAGRRSGDKYLNQIVVTLELDPRKVDKVVA